MSIFFKNGLVSNIWLDLCTLNCQKIKNKRNKNFFKKIEKKIFFEFLNFFISDQIYRPKIMTNNLSHVLASWLYTKKVCVMHILCIPRHNFQKNCKKKIFFQFLKFFISDWIYTSKTMTNNLSRVLSSWLYTKKV